MAKNISDFINLYDDWHRQGGCEPEDEYVDVLSRFLRGNVSIDISLVALKSAYSKGARYLVRGMAEYLPFKNNAFEISLSNGVLEHCIDPQAALNEMVRISKIQILIVHAELPFPLSLMRKILFHRRLLKSQGQPIEIRRRGNELLKMLEKAGMKVIYRGFYRYINLKYIYKRIPYGFVKIPSHHFIISISIKGFEYE